LEHGGDGHGPAPDDPFREKGSASLRRKARGFRKWRYAMEIGDGQWLDQEPAVTVPTASVKHKIIKPPGFLHYSVTINGASWIKDVARMYCTFGRRVAKAARFVFEHMSAYCFPSVPPCLLSCHKEPTANQVINGYGTQNRTSPGSLWRTGESGEGYRAAENR
jgi:hypothetical protein